MRAASRYPYYCRICWQEFEAPCEHNRGSYYGDVQLSGIALGHGERLNGFCKGDIHRKDEHYKRRPRIKRQPEPELNLDRGKPLKV